MQYDIWAEGYICTGQTSRATLLANVEADSFKEAVLRYKNNYASQAELVNVEALTYWGCRLFDNEAEARESFG